MLMQHLYCLFQGLPLSLMSGCGSVLLLVTNCFRNNLSSLGISIELPFPRTQWNTTQAQYLKLHFDIFKIL